MSDSTTSATPAKIPVVINGALGKMGRAIVKAVAEAEDMALVGAIDRDPKAIGEDIGEVIGVGPLEVPVMNDLEATLVMAQNEAPSGGSAVMVDVTHPDSVYGSARAALAYGVRPVIGTTGMSLEQIKDLAEFAD